MYNKQLFHERELAKPMKTLELHCQMIQFLIIIIYISITLKTLIGQEHSVNEESSLNQLALTFLLPFK